MTADERRVGQKIECPICKKTFPVPPGTKSPTAAPVRMSGFAVLSFCLALITFPLNALSRIAHFPVGLVTCIPAVICGRLALRQLRTHPDFRGRGFAIAGLIIGYIAFALSLITLGYLLLRPHGTMGTNGSGAQTQLAEPAVTTDPYNVKIPSQPVTGTVEKLPFTAKEAEIDNGILHLRDAAKDSNTEVLIFLFLKPDEGLTGLKRIVPSQTPVPLVQLRWKEGDSLRSLALPRGYVLRLELGDRSGNMISGKIYLELPSSFGTKLAGTFEAKVK